jgi:hypothetical protein
LKVKVSPSGSEGQGRTTRETVWGGSLKEGWVTKGIKWALGCFQKERKRPYLGLIRKLISHNIALALNSGYRGQEGPVFKVTQPEGASEGPGLGHLFHHEAPPPFFFLKIQSKTCF